MANRQKVECVLLQIKESLFCFCGTLFQPNNNQTNSFNIRFSSWRKLNPRICSQFCTFGINGIGTNKVSLIDDRLQHQITKVANTWKRQTLAHQNLWLREYWKSFIDHSNLLNFLATLKYLAKFDPVMILYLDSFSAKSGCILYFSPIIHEIICLLVERVLKSIISTC